MADQKITQLTALTNSNVDVADVLPIVDVSGGETDKITYQNLMRPKDSIFGIVDSADITKIVAFELSGLTTGTTRTLTVPDADMTLVGTTTTQTLTNKTLTTPQINMGSDATGDIYYRTSGGAFARLAIGTSAQILQVSSGGIPEWIANPSVSNATTTAAGIVELATTAETTTGTDATRAVTPDGLHDMTSLAGAAWFLDEDTMASDSATQTVSQQSVKAYVGSQGGLNGGVGNATTTKTYTNFMIPWIVSTNVPSGDFWTLAGLTAGSSFKGHWGYAEFVGGTDVTQSVLTTEGIGAVITAGSTSDLLWSTAKDVICEFSMTRKSLGGSEQMGWGLSVSNAPFIDFDDASVAAACFTVDASGNLYGHTSNGGGTTLHTETAISGVTLTDNNTYRIEFEAGTAVRFYVNGVLKATNTTNLPSAATVINFGVGVQGNGTDDDRAVIGPVWFAIEK